MNPALLLADEPTGNLDTQSADAVFALLRCINQEQGTTVLLVTHNPQLGKRCDKTIQVVDGLIQT
jgi:lipoprotein-releasing system ATP-binding protein